MRRTRSFPFVLLALFSLLSWSPGLCDSASRIESIRLPPGFEISLYAAGIPGARSMAIGPQGILFVGTRTGAICRITDKNGT